MVGKQEKTKGQRKPSNVVRYSFLHNQLPNEIKHKLITIGEEKVKITDAINPN